jgi:hypothetical protein
MNTTFSELLMDAIWSQPVTGPDYNEKTGALPKKAFDAPTPIRVSLDQQRPIKIRVSLLHVHDSRKEVARITVRPCVVGSLVSTRARVTPVTDRVYGRMLCFIPLSREGGKTGKTVST